MDGLTQKKEYSVIDIWMAKSSSSVAIVPHIHE